MVGAIKVNYWYGQWMMGLHQSLEWYYQELGAALEQEVDLESNLQLTFQLDALENEILSTFMQLKSLLQAEATSALATDVVVFKRIVDIACYLDTHHKTVSRKFAERDFDPPAPVAEY
jgi:hypothetical protein